MSDALLTPQVLHAALPGGISEYYGYGLWFMRDAAGQVVAYAKEGINAGASAFMRHFPAAGVNAVLLSNMEAGVWQALHYFAAQGSDYTAARREAAAGAESFASARVELGGLGDLPLIVLTAEWWVSGKPSKLKQAFTPLREEMARFSTRGRHVIVAGCDHTNLPVVRADAVADAVREVLAVRAE